ncbi:MAG TPA: protease pro-enzyme activation domain-containing protein [Gaiellaceae bacterium]|nr:protease pro-enzyme activation domain-containing protein [Gaiellaceae bacterium]
MSRAGTIARYLPYAAAAVLFCLPALREAPPAAAPFISVGLVPHLPQGTVALGAQGNGTLRLDVVLTPTDAPGLSALATAVSTPGSPSFRQFLSPAEFAARFGASNATIAAVKQSLRGRGLQVTRVSSNRLIVHVTGTMHQVERAFAVSLARYRLPDGAVVFANTTAPRLPHDLAAHVSQIVGLDSLAAPTRADLVRAGGAARRAAATRAPAAVDAGPQPNPSCAQQIADAGQGYPQPLVSSTDLAQAYGFGDLYQTGNFGQGVTVALIEFSSFISNDIGTFANCYGLTPHVQEIPVDGGPGPPGTSGPGVSNQVEAELDIEAILGLAPNATIDVYEAPPDTPGSSALDVFTDAIDNPAVQVISTSWGRCESASGSSLTNAEATFFQQAATEGKTIVSAAGDNGSEDCYGLTFGVQRTALAVDDPSSQPFVTGVGGTTFATLGPPATPVVWNDSSNPPAAGGGGVSSVNAMPGYQSSAAATLGVVNQYSHCSNGTGNCREVPDVAADAGSFFATYCTESGREGCDPDGWTGFGGTSLAAPIWGAFFALANASPACASKRIGFANPALYAIAGAGGAGYAGAFTDVMQGNNDLGFQNGLYPAGPGYDLATGLGTPIAGGGTGTDNGLVDQLCAAAAAVPVTAVTAISPAAGPLRGGAKVTIHGSGFARATAVHFGTKKAVSFTVVSATAIVAVAPSGAGTVGVTVTSSLGTSGQIAAARFRYLPVPTVTRLSPPTGTTHGGTRVTVTGTSFVEVTAVRFGARPARFFRVLSPTRIAAVAPAGTAAAAVTVTTPGGTSRKAPGGLFRYA